MKYSNKLLLTFIFLGFSFFTIKGLPISEQNYGTVRGKATNVLGFPLADLKIVLESDSSLYEFKTDSKGLFRFNVTTDYIYHLRTKAWKGKLPYNKDEDFYGDCYSYFRPYQRAPFEVSPEEELTINLVLTESGCLASLEETQGRFITITHGFMSKVRYETISIPKSNLEIWIQYDYRKTKGNVTRYISWVKRKTPSLFKSKREGVVVTYNSVNLYAGEVTYDRKKKLITLTEDVILEENGKDTSYKKIKIKIDGGMPKFTLKK